MNWFTGRFWMLIVLVTILLAVLYSHSRKKEGKEVTPQTTSAVIPIPEEALDSSAASQAAPEIPDAEKEGEEFFPKDPQILQKEIGQLLKETKNEKISGNLMAMVVPHAGIQYSGKVAAGAFRLLKEKSFDTVVILAPNHTQANNPGIVICPKGKLRTPLGKVEVDEDWAWALHKESSEFEFSQDGFEQEHAVLVQLPFLQATLKEFKVLPVLMGGRSAERCARLADALARTMGKRKVLFLATTHLSSGESYEKARRLDFLVTSALERREDETLLRYENEGLVRICGFSPVLTLFYLLQEKEVRQGRLMQYANSGDTTGNKEGRIVGYAAVIYAGS